MRRRESDFRRPIRRRITNMFWLTICGLLILLCIVLLSRDNHHPASMSIDAAKKQYDIHSDGFSFPTPFIELGFIYTNRAFFMEVENKLVTAGFTIVGTFFFIYLLFRKQQQLAIVYPKKQKISTSCYLNTPAELSNKPQSTFKRIIADNSYSKFKHLQSDSQNKSDSQNNSHPYKGEISKLLNNPNLRFLNILDHHFNIDNENNKLLEMRDTYVWVETETQLLNLVYLLSKESVFAVDTEQHSLRSYLGFTALIQISTIRDDYLLDTIKLHDMMRLLRPVFANPQVCKVFHGADNDIIWLQRDFHIYVVNLFDTAKACDVLVKPQRSLAFLLEVYCGVATNKLFQKEDWRQRPLSAEMIQYARTDAHYLMYIAHRLCIELKFQKPEMSTFSGDINFMLETSRRSNATCLQLYSKDIEGYPGETTASSIISRCLNDHVNISSSHYNTKFQEHVRRLCLWRDILARIHDESLRFVLSENAIIMLASKLPVTEKDVTSLISDADVTIDSPSPVVNSHMEILIDLFKENVTNFDNMFDMFIIRNLGAADSCPVSMYNYRFLSKTNLELTNGFIPNGKELRASRQKEKKNSRQTFVKKFSCKSPVYHNCKIYANDGRLLCYCDRKKLEWYFNRDLAKLVGEDPNSIMLLFEPKGRPEDEGNSFYIQSKKNICVGCGEGNHYLRYRIIPSCYRIHFPEHLKSHRSHDIVLLCVDCHEIAHVAAEKYKRVVAREIGIPLFVRKVVDIDNPENATVLSPMENYDKIGVSPTDLRTAAIALLRHGPKMPAHRYEELMQIVIKYYGRPEISHEDLENAFLIGMSPYERKRFEKKKTCFRSIGANVSMKIDQSHVRPNDLGNEMSVTNPTRDAPLNHVSRMSSLGHGPHGKQVVEYLLTHYGENGVCEFCQKWRQVFVDAINPSFLPAGWDVMHSGRRDFGEFSVYKPTNKSSDIIAAPASVTN